MTPSAPIQDCNWQACRRYNSTDKDSSQPVMDWKKVVIIKGAYIDTQSVICLMETFTITLLETPSSSSFFPSNI